MTSRLDLAIAAAETEQTIQKITPSPKKPSLEHLAIVNPWET
jgi:hypothetical protein